jgi:hypothetical protein
MAPMTGEDKDPKDCKDSKDGKDQKDGKDEKDGRGSRWLVWTVLALWGLLAAVFVQRLAGRSLDDFFITYRYAWNIAHGNGFVFNPGERVYGVTDPGMVFWLAFWHRLSGVPVHQLGTLTTAAALLATAGLMGPHPRPLSRHPARPPRERGASTRPQQEFFPLPRRGAGEAGEGGQGGEGSGGADQPAPLLAACLGGTLLLGSTFLWAVHGAGVTVALALLTAAAVSAGRRPGVAGALAGAAVWFRPDAGVGLAALGLLLWREKRRFPLLCSAVAAAVLGVGVLASWLYFGTAVPNTLAAKRSFAAWDPAARASGAAFWPAAVPLLHRHLGSVWPAWAAAGITGLVPLWRRGGRPGRLLILFGASLALLYPLLGVPFFAWYIAPPVAALLFGIGFLVDGLAAGGRRPAVAVLLVLLVAVPAAVRGGRWLRGMASLPHYEAYRAAGLWIRDHLDPSAQVSALEVGTLAYFSERHVEDLLGLVTPEAIPFVARHEVAQAFYNHPTEVLVLKPSLEGLIGGLRGKPWFLRRYEEAARFPAGEDGDVVVYRHRHGRHAPPL